jgi:hypothetical protein
MTRKQLAVRKEERETIAKSGRRTRETDCSANVGEQHAAAATSALSFIVRGEGTRRRKRMMLQPAQEIPINVFSRAQK